MSRIPLAQGRRRIQARGRPSRIKRGQQRRTKPQAKGVGQHPQPHVRVDYRVEEDPHDRHIVSHHRGKINPRRRRVPNERQRQQQAQERTERAHEHGLEKHQSHQLEFPESQRH